MLRRLTEEVKSEIKRLQESGISDAEISRRLGVSSFCVRYQRPEVRERHRNYMREYFRIVRLKQDPDLKQLLDFIYGREVNLDCNNIYLRILKLLASEKYGIKYGQIERRIDEKIWGKLKKLKNLGLINYENRRYTLSENGKSLMRALYES